MITHALPSSKVYSTFTCNNKRNKQPMVYEWILIKDSKLLIPISSTKPIKRSLGKDGRLLSLWSMTKSEFLSSSSLLTGT